MTENDINRLSRDFKCIINCELEQIWKAERIKYVNSIKSCSWKLWQYKNYIETMGLQIKFWKNYTKGKYYLKNCVIENTCEEDFNGGYKEEALYEWLKICVNPQNEINYDFCFEKYKIDREQEIKNILFVKENGKEKLRELLNNKDWHIRLKTIENWFLKRYDWNTARKILIYRKSNLIDIIKLFFPRLSAAIIIGLMPFFWNENSYLTNDFSLGKIILLTAILLTISISYLFYECYNIINNVRISIRRGGFLGIISFLFLSFILIFIIYFLYGINYIKNSFLISSAAIFIGIFIQILWEEKTITEPL